MKSTVDSPETLQDDGVGTEGIKKREIVCVSEYTHFFFLFLFRFLFLFLLFLFLLFSKHAERKAKEAAELILYHKISNFNYARLGREYPPFQVEGEFERPV